MFHSN